LPEVSKEELIVQTGAALEGAEPPLEPIAGLRKERDGARGAVKDAGPARLRDAGAEATAREGAAVGADATAGSSDATAGASAAAE